MRVQFIRTMVVECEIDPKNYPEAIRHDYDKMAQLDCESEDIELLFDTTPLLSDKVEYKLLKDGTEISHNNG